MKTIVHIGMAKTGSTALQNSFKALAAYLARHKVLYPENPGDDGANHPALAVQFVPSQRLPQRMRGRSRYAEPNAAGFFAHPRRQIAAERPDALVFEGLFRAPPRGKHATLRDSCRGLETELRFVAYLRRPSEHYLSGLLQCIKASSTVSGPSPCAYRRVLQSYKACFGRNAVTTRPFDRRHLPQGDIVADFCGAFLGDFGDELDKLRRGNETLSTESMDLLWRGAFHADRDNVFTQDRNALRRALARAGAQVDAPPPLRVA